MASDVAFPLADAVTRDYLLHHRLCPIGFTDDGELKVVAAPDVFPEAIGELAELYGRPVVIEDAGVKWKRTNAQRYGYSIAEQNLDEFLRWDFMPWE